MPSVRYLIPCALLLGLYAAQGVAWLMREKYVDRRGGALMSAGAILVLAGVTVYLQPIILDLFYRRVLQG